MHDVSIVILHLVVVVLLLLLLGMLAAALVAAVVLVVWEEEGGVHSNYSPWNLVIWMRHDVSPIWRHGHRGVPRRRFDRGRRPNCWTTTIMLL